MILVTLTLVVGNPKASSRTLRVAEALAVLVGRQAWETHAIDLAEHASEIHAWPSAVMDDALSTVTRSRVLVVASPTYKGAYSGLLKSFLDRLQHRALAGVIALPVMTGDRPEHAMAPETSLRPLLAELGAVVPVKSLYFPMTRFAQKEDVVAEWASENRAGLDFAASMLG